MNDNLKIEYKVGAIEFRAEGPVDAVEQQRLNFMNSLLPAAVEAMVRTQGVNAQEQFINDLPQTQMLESPHQNDIAMIEGKRNDFLRTCLASFLKSYGALTEIDFTLFAAYYDENKNGKTAFSIDDVKRYYTEARRPLPQNPSMSLYELAKKGHIMDATPSDDAKTGKYYMLTESGISYIEGYVPKENSIEKKPRTKARRTINKIPSAYASINADSLNLNKYPAIKSFSGAKEQIITAMYIITTETEYDWFTVNDIIYLLVNVFEIHADKDKVNGVFKRNKSMFVIEKDETNKKAFRYKLLSGAKDYVQKMIKNQGNDN